MMRTRSLSEGIRKIAGCCEDSEDYCAFPHVMGCGCRSHCGCHDCIADALRALAVKVELIERGRSEHSEIAERFSKNGGGESIADIEEITAMNWGENERD